MTIAFPGPTGFDFGALLGRRTKNETVKRHALDAKDSKRLRMEIAHRFRKAAAGDETPGRLSEEELQSRSHMSSLRGALYDRK